MSTFLPFCRCRWPTGLISTARGTTVILHLRDDAIEFLEFDRLKDLLTKYSAYIEFPIYLEEFKEKHVQVDPETGEAKSDEESDEIQVKEDDSTVDEPSKELESNEDGDDEADEDEIEVEEEDADKQEKEEKSETKLEKVETSEWKHINDQKPIWRRNPNNVTNDEYMKFYDSIKKSPGVRTDN
eukprot:Plantae.Rhodophyta-Purpureofilum_apyrenoidigerum.ctg34747.p3 GENE.Plantae.Rhodophyta-Purpureofilum_apyrenoidigerum.ctg34747~~Plantae.Rhodophyta-Purpureofilum_apyrenoidigerum.ctg34747.p3  ORF type:complete len:184 (-),score=61.67 Plantae.Rhodophyta-Purpureofilum_apyrenoidigerum.ctg34747:234-785(-)